MSQEDEWWEGLESTRDVFESRPTYLKSLMANRQIQGAPASDKTHGPTGNMKSSLSWERFHICQVHFTFHRVGDAPTTLKTALSPVTTNIGWGASNSAGKRSYFVFGKLLCSNLIMFS
jgi:hypothetical protein